MATKSKLKALVKRGNLSGYEAAQLILQDSWEVDHGREGFLSPGEIQQIKQNLQGEQARIYNQWITLYQAVDYTIKVGEIVAYSVLRQLERAMGMGLLYVNDLLVSFVERVAPRVVTAKEFEGIKTQAREEARAGTENLYRVLISMALAGEGSEWEEAGEDLEGFVEAYPERAKEMVGALIHAIKEGRLHPGRLTKGEAGRLEELSKTHQRAWEEATGEIKARRREAMEKAGLDPENSNGNPEWWELSRPFDRESAKALDRIWEEREAIKRKAAERGATKKQVASLVKLLEEAERDGLKEAHLDELKRYLTTVGAVVDAGLLAHTWIETAHLMEGPPFAILDENHVMAGGMIDEEGRFKGRPTRTLLRVDEELREPLKAELERRIGEGVIPSLRNFLALKSVVATVGELIGVPFTEDLEERMADLRLTTARYNSMVEGIPDLARHTFSQMPFPELPRLDLEALSPSPEEIDHLRERFSISLGDKWWEQAAQFIEDHSGGRRSRRHSGKAPASRPVASKPGASDGQD